MAKLTNVKTIDMVNGEITKVAYEGAEYAKTDEPVKEGDLFQLCKGHSVIGGEVDAFYRTFKDSDGDIMIPTSMGGMATIIQRNGHGVAFRKISVQTPPTLEERVSSLESDVASLKSSESSLKGEKVEAEKPSAIKEGDEVTINFAVWDKHGILDDLTEGKRYKVIKLRDGLNIIDDAGDERNLFVDEPEVVNVVKLQANETIEFEGAQYRKVDREARGGDVIISTVEHSSMVNVGKPYKVNDRLSVIVEGDYTPSVYNAGRNCSNVDVYEPIEQAKYIPKVGDIVVVTKPGTHTDLMLTTLLRFTQM